MQVPLVQTYSARKAASILSEKLNTQVTIGKVYYIFFNKLIINDLNILSSETDTILSCKKLSATISARELIYKSNISLKQIKLDDGLFNLVIERDSTSNISKIFGVTSEENDQSEEGIFSLPQFTIRDLRVNNFCFTLKNQTRHEVSEEGIINFNDLSVSDINLAFRDIKSLNDTLSCDIRNISLYERSGFDIQKMSGGLMLCANNINISNLNITERYTKLKANTFSLNYSRFKDFNDFVDLVKIESDFNGTFLDFRTLSVFAKALKGNNLSFFVNGFVEGPVTNLKSDNLRVTSPSGLTLLNIKTRISGLPDPDITMAFVDVDYCTTTTNDISNIVASINGGAREPFFNNLSSSVRYNFKGRLAGLLNDFVANGDIKTNIGELYVDILLRGDSEKEGLYLEGTLNTDNFNLGSLIKSDEPGELTVNSKMSAIIREESKGGSQFYIDHINIEKLVFNDYPYSNINAAGSYLEDKFDGKIICHDPNLDFIFQGLISLSSERDSYYDFYADLLYANLYNLNFDRRDTLSSINLRTLAKFTQKKEKDILGTIEIRDFDYTNSNGVFNIGDISVKSNFTKGSYEATLNSSFARALYKGDRFIDRFVTRLTNNLIYNHLPNLDDNNRSDDKEADSVEEYHLDITFTNTRSISQFLLPGFFIAPNSKLSIDINGSSDIDLSLTSNAAGYKNNIGNNIFINAKSNKDSTALLIESAKVRSGNIEIENVKTNAIANNNIVNLNLNYLNSTELKNSIDFSTDITIERPANGIGKNLKIAINPSELYFNDIRWLFDKSLIEVSDSLFRFNSFAIKNRDQSLTVNGSVSPNITDSLMLSVSNFDISPVNYFIDPAFNLEGNFSGGATLTTLYTTAPKILINLLGENVSVSNESVGELDISSEWDSQLKQFNLIAKSRLLDYYPLNAIGSFNPAKKWLDISANLNKLAIKYFEPFLTDIINESSGTISGMLRLNGPLNKLVLNATRGTINDMGFTVLFTKVPYKLNGPFSIIDNRLIVDRATLKDRAGNTGSVNGGLFFPYFNDIFLEAKVDFTNLECINTTEQDNESFYGIAYGTGNISISGPIEKIVMDISITTNRNTTIHIPLPNTSVATRTNLLSFNTPPKRERPREYFNRYGYVPPNEPQETKESELEVKLRTRVNPDAELLIEIDKSVGDIIKSYGNGLINIDINPSKDLFSIHGDYIINRGLYTFVLQGIFKREFNIKEGGNLAFNGDILKTRLDLTALYNTKAAVNTLIADTSSVSNRRNVECSITMQGELLNPRLDFGINIPDIDPSTKIKVDAALNTEDKVIKQVMSLLVSGSFIPDIQSSIVNNSTLLYSNATEILSNQINNIFNQLDIPLDLSFNYHPGQNGRDIFDAAVSAQLFDNRVIINGNIGSSKYINQNSNVVGDIDVEVKLDDKGRFRAKAFSHSADQYSNYLDNSQRSGIGLVYQEEFNTFKELFNSIFRRKRGAQKETK